MKKALENWAYKMMARAHMVVRCYQQAMQDKQELPLAKKNMLYGHYLRDMDEAV